MLEVLIKFLVRFCILFLITVLAIVLNAPIIGFIGGAFFGVVWARVDYDTAKLRAQTIKLDTKPDKEE